MHPLAATLTISLADCPVRLTTPNSPANSHWTPSNSLTQDQLKKHRFLVLYCPLPIHLLSKVLRCRQLHRHLLAAPPISPPRPSPRRLQNHVVLLLVLLVLLLLVNVPQPATPWQQKKKISNKYHHHHHHHQDYTWDRKKASRENKTQDQDQLWLQLLQKISSSWKLHQIQRDLKAVDDPILF